MWAAETMQRAVPQGEKGLMVLSSWPGVPAGGRPGWAAGHPYAAAGRHDGVRGALAGGVNQKRTTTPRRGHDRPRPAPTREKPEMAFMPPSADVLGRARDRRAVHRPKL